MMAGRNIYVTGASGRLGREVLRALPGAVPLVRKPSGLKGEIVTDYSFHDLERILRNADVVIHLAASRDFLDMGKAREGNVILTQRLATAAPPKARIVFASSISVYGKSLAAIPADEDTPTRPDTPYAKTKLQAEKIIASREDYVILRIGPIYGPGFEEYFRVLRMIQDGTMRVIGSGNNHVPFVHVEDVARAIAAAVSGGRGVYVLVGECPTQNEAYAMAAKELGVEPPRKHVPAILAMLLARISLIRSSFSGTKPNFIPEDIAVLSSNRQFNCARAQKDLGFSPRPILEGIMEMAILMGEQDAKSRLVQMKALGTP
jgi:nucleoside-diphosphate-sugar epimerase